VSLDRALVVGALLWSRKESLKAIGREVRSRIAGEIASDDLCSGISLARGYELVRQATRLTITGKETCVQLQQGLHAIPSRL
jgi:hypothetical protein